MDTAIVLTKIRNFLEVRLTNSWIIEQRSSQERRSTIAFTLLTSDGLANATREELEKLFQDTDAWYGVRGKQLFWRNLFGEHNERLGALRSALLEILRRAEAGLNVADFNELLHLINGVGPAYLSEILTLRFPDRYWMVNGQVRQFLEKFNVNIQDEMPWGKKTNRGEEYFVTGRYLTEFRRLISQELNTPVDYQITDLFVYYANNYMTEVVTDPWINRIAAWAADIPAERIAARRQGEARARQRLVDKLGGFDEADLRQFMEDLSSDFSKGRASNKRFSPAFYGPQVNMLVRSLDSFNTWAKRIWQAEDEVLDDLLDEFWDTTAVYGGGISLPTGLLYLRDPEKYNVWLVVTTTGIQRVTGVNIGKYRTAQSYRRYNEALNTFRTQYNLVPQAVDIILWQIGQDERADKASGFPGFSADTFRFLVELSKNNTDEWMHKNDHANKLRYRQVLREPLRDLFTAIVPKIIQMDPALEGEVKFGKILGTIKKRWPDEKGPYNTYHWGAFYRKNRTKQTDAQLFITVEPTYLEAGLSVSEEHGADILANFRRNVQKAPDVFLQLLSKLPGNLELTIESEPGASVRQALNLNKPEDLVPLGTSNLFEVSRRYPADDPVLQQAELVDELSDLFQALYPLYRFSTSEDPSEITHLADEGDEEEEAGEEERYSLEDLTIDTYEEIGFWFRIEALLKEKKQIIFYGPPGTGKTWVARQFARYWVENSIDPDGEVQVVQFHPSYAYEEFIEGIRPQSVEVADGRKEISYPVKKGVFRRFADEARLHPDQRYVLIIDEINRGELPRILGELLFLLEYRQETITLPYSGEPFSIPENLYLIGTMNTADRSIALVDHALRRRFHFIAMKPKPEILRAFLEEKDLSEMGWVADLLHEVNRKLDLDSVDWHLHIGHSYFMLPDLDQAHVELIWEHSIMPTLEEYFYRKPERRQAYSLAPLKAALGAE